MDDEQRQAGAPSTRRGAGTQAPEHGGHRQAARMLQLGSGIVLWLYVSIHLVNHALGIWSIDIAERGLTLAIALWRSAPGTVLLYGAAGLHFALAIRTIYSRRHWALPRAEWFRQWAGLSLPLLLIRHVVGTRVATTLFGFEPTYERVIVSLLTSGTQGLQIALLAPGWVHGCLGLWFHLRRHAAREAGAGGRGRAVADIVGGRFRADGARDRAGAPRGSGARRGAGCAPRRAGRLAPLSRHRLSVADRDGVRRRPVAKPDRRRQCASSIRRAAARELTRGAAPLPMRQFAVTESSPVARTTGCACGDAR
ncbi:hypothetical protein [Burkholderia stagnalis]|uniref:hypothetical protein n=1 Tax=Burkholderia stagnalis TaxID=1503054 RepID=UPI0039BFD668